MNRLTSIVINTVELIEQGMKQVTLHIEDSKFGTFIEFLKTLDYVKVESQGKEAEILKSIEKGLQEVKLIEEGKLKSRPVEDFLSEL